MTKKNLIKKDDHFRLLYLHTVDDKRSVETVRNDDEPKTVDDWRLSVATHSFPISSKPQRTGVALMVARLSRPPMLSLTMARGGEGGFVQS